MEPSLVFWIENFKKSNGNTGWIASGEKHFMEMNIGSRELKSRLMVVCAFLLLDIFFRGVYQPLALLLETVESILISGPILKEMQHKLDVE